MRQGKAEAIQDSINREEMMSLSLQNSAKMALVEVMRGYWLVCTAVLSEQEIAGIRIVTEGCTGLSAVKKAHQQTVVARRREGIRDDRCEQEDRSRDTTVSAGENFHTLFDGEESDSQRQIWKVSTSRDLWYATMTKLNTKHCADHHRGIDPAEAEDPENNRAPEKLIHRKEKARAKEKGGESSLERPFQFKLCTVGIYCVFLN